MSELKDTQKIKVVALYEQTPKQVEPELIPTIKIAYFWPQKVKKKLPIKQIKFKARIEGDIENICCSAT